MKARQHLCIVAAAVAALSLCRFARAGDDDASALRGMGQFELLVVGPAGKPVPEALVELRGDPLPTAEQIQRGTFVRKSRYGTFVKADAQGRVTVKLPAEPKRFNVSISTAGYGPYWAAWSSEDHEDPIPARFTAELEAGWSVGGVIVDDQGKPVAGASVDPNIAFKKRPGDQKELYVGQEAVTDAEGKWRFDSVPVSLDQVWVEIRAPEFRPNRQGLSRPEFGIGRDQQPAAKIALARGLTVTGKVTDEQGGPIAGARVHTKFANDLRKALTGPDGTYQLNGCEPKLARLVVSAKGRATDMQEVQIDAEMEPVNFQMKPAGKVRVRVVDQQGNPVPKTRIFFQRWRGNFFGYFEFDGVNQYTDEKGVWEWDEAPLDEFQADICPPGGMQLGKQPLLARDEEYVFRALPALVISGKVVDAQTKKPIEKFSVLPGARFDAGRQQWHNQDRFAASGGKFQLRRVYDAFAHVVRIEALGYRAEVSRDIHDDEGNVTIDFELHKSEDVQATVLTPAGKPAAKAQIALGIPGAQIDVKNGAFGPQTYATKFETDERGQFRFPAPETPFQLVILHATGLAHVKAAPDNLPAKIPLQGWARVTGTFHVGKDPAPFTTLEIDSSALHSYGEDAPHIFTQHKATTDKEGRFVFEQVIPGQARIGRQIIFMVEQGATEATSSCRTPANLPAGETTELKLGGTGRSVIGRLQAPQGFAGKIKWSLANIRAEIPVVPPPAPTVPANVEGDAKKRAAWFREWLQSPAGKAWTTANEATRRLGETSHFFWASAGADGTFRIDDMPPGTYLLSAHLDGKVRLALPEYKFTIPPIEGDRSDEPLDLGDVRLE